MAVAGMIRTVNEDQRQILRDIMALYCPLGFEMDPTYSHGAFYGDGVPEPRWRYDLAPSRPDVEQADCRALAHEAGAVASIVFDPPFIHAHGKESCIGNRFTSLPTQHAIRALYFAALVEFYRVLKPKGILVFKCQDIIESGRQVMNHCIVWEMATRLGYVERDLFILVNQQRMVGHNHGDQQHARKTHSYFWVFEKGARR